MRATLLLVCTAFFSTMVWGQKTPAGKTPQKTSPKPSEGYQIQVKVTPLRNQWLYLYNYYGKDDRFQLADSTRLNDKSEGVFKGPKKLYGGIYLLVTEKRVRLLDILMDAPQHFSVSVDSANPNHPVITGSKDNTLYQDYVKFLEQFGPRLNDLQKQLAQAGNKNDSAKVQQLIVVKNKELQDFRERVVKTEPKSMLAAFFNTMKKPEFPEYPKRADGSVDSLYPFRYVQEHYWDDMDFADDRLVRTPFLEAKIDEYYKYYVSPEPDSIIDKVKEMLLLSREGKEMYRYLLAKFTNRYINPEIMGQDKVFVYLFENHYLKGDTTILSDKDKKTVMDRGWSLMLNQIGGPAPAMNLVNQQGKMVGLYDVPAKYTFVVFWDPNCGHCKETVPKIDSIYRAKWKGMGVKIYAVNNDEKAMKAWLDFIKDHKLEDWIHVYQTKEQRDEELAAGRPNFRQSYDVYKTPTLYLLDENKRIIAKNLDVNGFDTILNGKQKKEAKK